MKKLEEMCQELLSEARKEGMSKSALAVLISKNLLKSKSKKGLTDETERNFFAKGKNKKDLKHNKEEDNMSKNGMLDKIESLNRETMELVADIQDYYSQEIKKLEAASSKKILSATTEEEKKQTIEEYHQKVNQIKAKEISERQNVGREVMKIIMTK